MNATTLGEIEALLSEALSDASQRARSTFDILAGGADRPIVLYGAGGLGRRTADGLARLGRAPVAFADRKASHGISEIGGIPVLSPGEAVARFGTKAVFVVSIWNAQTDHRYPESRDFLHSLGVRNVAPVLALYWKYSEIFLPYYCLDLPERLLDAKLAILSMARLLADDMSRDILIRQLRWRLNLDFDALPVPVPGLAYFQTDILPLRDDEFFVDCGAYDGDSLRIYIKLTTGSKATALALEPDPNTYRRLVDWLAKESAFDRKRIRTQEVAVGRRRERLRFDASGLASAGAKDSGDIEVDSAPLDEILDGEFPTFVKMDTEGAEIDALVGGEVVIRRARPALAICAYHRPDHLWSIPLLLHKLLPTHRLYLRPHGYEGWDLVCYGIEPHRK